MSELLISVENVSLFLPGDANHKNVLHDICWQVERGGHCALLGANGSGKSPLLRLLRGELWPATGRILWHGPDGPEDSPLAGKSMAALVSPAQQENYQRQAWDLTGRDLLLTGFEDTPLIYTEVSALRRQAVDDMAARLNAEGLLERRIPTFSQGQLRLLLLGRALLRAPSLLLLDECDEGLDDRHRRIFFETLGDFIGRCTVLMTAHRAANIPDWCAGRRYMRAGRIFDMPAPQEPAETAPAPRPVQHQALEPQADARPLLDLENVTVFIDRQEVLHNVSWSMHKGENWRITGANGSGKSTLLRLLAGDEFVAAGGRLDRLLPGQGGKVETLEEVRKGVRLVSDLSQALYGYSLTAFDMVCTGFDNSIGVYRRFSEKERTEARQRMAQMFPEAGPEALDALGRQSIRQLSTGQLRRMFLARALVGSPDILLLDEPCSGLDAPSRAQYMRLLDQLAAQGIQIVFVSHHDEDAPLCINREAHMENGRLRLVP